MKVVPAKALPANLKDKNLSFRIQVSVQDCSGCSVCAAACPAKGTLTMAPLTEEIKTTESANWDWCRALPPRTQWFETPNTYKLSQFRQPLFEFSAACAGCGETAYIKLLTQLFGERMVVCNAAGCAAAFSLTYGSCPYAVTPEGWGPALCMSLFEENAEFCFGMMRGQRALRQQLLEAVTAALADPAVVKSAGDALCGLLKVWAESFEDSEKALRTSQQLLPLVAPLEKSEVPMLRRLHSLRDAFVKVTYWTMGGDGWAYDIDYGGLDHVLSLGAETRVIVLDTEVYSNTGGQVSKATPEGGIHKFAAKGKERAKKDLGAICMSYGHIFVAQVCLDANPQQALRAFMEADTYPGPAIVLCYAPCIEHGIEGGSEQFVTHAKLAVSSAYWPLYRFNPLNVAKGKPALEIDGPAVAATTPEKINTGMREFLEKENRFARLARERPERAASLHKSLCDHVVGRWENLKRRATQDAAPATVQPAAK
jgi:pyruvate-ferredoxin/flavodoxin oxidoreductase